MDSFLDGHCKLMGYQRSTFSLVYYGYIDTASRKVIWLCIWNDNCDPKRVARLYFNYLFEKITVPPILRIHKVSETGNMTTMHSFLRSGHGDWKILSNVLYLENLQQIRSKDGGGSYMVVLDNTLTLSWRMPLSF